MDKREKAVRLLELMGVSGIHEENHGKEAQKLYKMCIKQYGKKEEFSEFLKRYKKYTPEYTQKEIGIVCKHFTHKTLDILISYYENNIPKLLLGTIRGIQDEVDKPLHKILYKPYPVPDNKNCGG